MSEFPRRCLIATVKPSYILYNNTEFTLNVRPNTFTGRVSQTMLSKIHSSGTHSTVLRFEPGESQPIVFWNSIDSQREEPEESSSQTQTVCLGTKKDIFSSSSWSIFLSLKFVRHSFCLPVHNEKNLYTACLLTRHEMDGSTYLVVKKDPSPRLYINNLCGSDLEVREYNTKGVNAFPQQIPSGQEVVYEPPSLAKIYPLVFDEEVMGDLEKEMKIKATRPVLHFCRKPRVDKDAKNDIKSVLWSEPIILTSDEDRFISIPDLGPVFISSHKRGLATYTSIIPTSNVPLQSSHNTFPTTSNSLLVAAVSFKLEQLVVCIDDEVSNQAAVCELLRLYGDEIDLSYSSTTQEGAKLKLSMQSCRIDNMHKQSSAEYAVTMVPRSEHTKQSSLSQIESLPLTTLIVHFNPHSASCIDLLHISTQPVTIQVEDSLIQHMKEMIYTFLPPTILIAPSIREKSPENPPIVPKAGCLTVVPALVVKESERDASPLVIDRFVIDPASFYLNASITLKVLLSCNDTPFQFSEYKLESVYSNWSEVIQIIGARYISSVFMNAGWVIGSLELLGSPGTLINCVGRGLRDLVSLPYEGLRRSPGMFVLGLGQGTASFVRNCSTGALSSVTSLASSLSKNMERLSMDPEHASYQDQIRLQMPTTQLSEGIKSGVSSFGLSLISAVAGLVNQPMQSFQRIDEGASTLGATSTVLAGVGKGLLGVVTKPMGGAMELVSKTGQGIMQVTGLARSLTHRELNDSLKEFVGPILKRELRATLLKCAW